MAADYFAARSDNITHCTLYSDGVILYLAVSDQTAQRWIDRLDATEYARSQDGLVWALIIRGDPTIEQARAYAVGEKIHGKLRHATYQDNRGSDANTIEKFVALLEEYVEGQ
jgi:hypothetical protein